MPRSRSNTCGAACRSRSSRSAERGAARRAAICDGPIDGELSVSQAAVQEAACLKCTNTLVHLRRGVNAMRPPEERGMNGMMWRAGAGAIAALGMALSGPPAQAQQKSEIALSRQPGIFYMPSHIMEKQKLIEKHAAALGVPGVTTKWINLQRRRRADRRAAGRRRRYPQYRHRQSAAAVGPHPRRRQGHRRHLGAADDADQPRRQHQVAQGFRPQRQDRGADREGLDPGDRAADRGRRSCSAPTNGRSSMPTPCSSAIPTPMWR